MYLCANPTFPSARHGSRSRFLFPGLAVASATYEWQSFHLSPIRYSHDFFVEKLDPQSNMAVLKPPFFSSFFCRSGHGFLVSRQPILSFFLFFFADSLVKILSFSKHRCAYGRCLFRISRYFPRVAHSLCALLCANKSSRLRCYHHAPLSKKTRARGRQAMYISGR